MNVMQKDFSGKQISNLFGAIIIILVGIFSMVGCEGKKKTPLWSMALLGGSIAPSNGVAETAANDSTSVATPTFNRTAGTYNSDQTVTISTTTLGATIYYTVDGSPPTASSTQYTGTIFIAGHGTIQTIKAYAVKAGMTDSSVTTAEYTINYDAVAMPVFSPIAGTYTSDQTVAISTTTSGATIYYTVDGSPPTTASTQYTGTISVAGNGTVQTIKAFAVKSGMTDSSLATASYTIGYPVASPTFSPVASFYSTAQNVSISTVTSGTSIYYTIDGATPTNGSMLYSTAVHIWFLAGKTVKAYAIKSGMADSVVSTLSGIFSYPPLKTGQTTVYAVGDNGTNQTGSARGYTGPTQHATYTSNYTTKDNATGLVWKTCSQGLSGANCATGTAVTLTWVNASADPTNGCSALNSANNGNGYAGLKTWRLPSIQELETLLDFGKSNSAINTTAFPATVADAYWTSTPFVSNTSWYVGFYNGFMSTDANTNNFYVRCISGPPKDSRFSSIDNGDGTIKDNATGLIWQKCSRGQTNDTTCSGTATTATWTNAITYCSGLSLVGRTWRLPQNNELMTIVDTIKATAPVIDTTVFPATLIDVYWSSTSYLPNTGLAWGLSFAGILTFTSKSNTHYTRCVSGP